MDEFGIAVQVISTGSPGIQGYADAPTAVVKAKQINDAQRRSSGSIPAALRALQACPPRTRRLLPTNLNDR